MGNTYLAHISVSKYLYILSSRLNIPFAELVCKNNEFICDLCCSLEAVLL